MEPVREICELKPKTVTEPKPGAGFMTWDRTWWEWSV